MPLNCVTCMNFIFNEKNFFLLLKSALLWVMGHGGSEFRIPEDWKCSLIQGKTGLCITAKMSKTPFLTGTSDILG